MSIHGKKLYNPKKLWAIKVFAIDERFLKSKTVALEPTILKLDLPKDDYMFIN